MVQCPEEEIDVHELAVTESILNISLRHAEQADAAAITDLYLVIGDLSSIVDESVQFYWDMISKDTIAEGASLHFERIPLEMKCHDCGTVYHPDHETMGCPACGGVSPAIIKGEEFYLDSITVENSSEKNTLEKEEEA